jgi:hypothetical protein
MGTEATAISATNRKARIPSAVHFMSHHLDFLIVDWNICRIWFFYGIDQLSQHFVGF